MSKCKHSEKVPRFYKVAATIAKDYHDDIGTKLQLVRERINQNLVSTLHMMTLLKKIIHCIVGSESFIINRNYFISKIQGN